MRGVAGTKDHNCRSTSARPILSDYPHVDPRAFSSTRFERGEIRPDLFRAAYQFGLDGLVSKHRDRPDQAGRSKHWVNVKSRKHHAFARVKDSFSAR